MDNRRKIAAPGMSAEAKDAEKAGRPVPVVFCADAHYGAYVTVILQSLIDHAAPQNTYIICIFDCGLKPADLARLERQIEGRANFSLKIYPLQKYLAENAAAFSVLEGQHVSAAAYGRLLIPQLCPEYDRIIYADIDMIFSRDIAELLSFDLGRNYIAGAADKNIEAERQSRPGIRKYSREVLGLRDDEVYINSGLLLFNAALWRAEGLVGRCLELLRRGHLKRHDQDAINFICKGKICYLPQSWNTACKLWNAGERRKRAGEEQAAGAELPAVCHFVGALKPWHLPPEQADGQGGAAAREAGADSAAVSENSPEPEARQAQSAPAGVGRPGGGAGQSPAAGRENTPAALWWHYARRTEAYAELRQGALAYQARLNQNLGARGFYLFGLPLWTAQTTPKKVKYRLLGAPVAKSELNIKTGARSFSLLGLKLRRR